MDIMAEELCSAQLALLALEPVLNQLRQDLARLILRATSLFSPLIYNIYSKTIITCVSCVSVEILGSDGSLNTS